VRRLARAVRPRWGGPVVPAFLDFNLPTVPSVLRGLGGGSVIVPALLTRAYHGRVDVPAVLAAAGVPARAASVLGPEAPGEDPDPLLLAALRRRLDDLGTAYDGVALLAAGTRDEAARATVEASAGVLERALGVPCAAAYASAASPTGEAAVRRLRARGARRVVGAAYFLAPGFLYDRVADSALTGGAVGVAAPLGDAPEVADLVVARALAGVSALVAA
jgi:sirohydrochlorin ferrochelatase